MVVITTRNKPGNLLLPLASHACPADTETSFLPIPCAAPILSLRSAGIVGPFDEPFTPPAPLHLPGVPREGEACTRRAAPRPGTASSLPRPAPALGQAPNSPGRPLAAVPGGRGSSAVSRPARSCRSAAGSSQAGKLRTPLAPL